MIRQEALPTEMQLLLRDYPRDAWPDHPNFAASIQNWMGAHVMFGQLADLLKEDAEAYLDKSLEDQRFAARLAHFGHLLVGNLHGHHSWEDRSFFPELSAADDRFDAGLDTLETDHQVLDGLLDRLARTGNRIVTLAQMDATQLPQEADALHHTVTDVQALLTRHLADEEDLVVPILLHHKLRG